MKIKTDLRAGATTVYGADWCSWCSKQKDYLDNQGIDYTFVDCTKDGASCPSYVESFPTINHNGKIFKGFTEL